MSQIQLYQIAYSEAVLQRLDPGYLPLINMGHDRHDWREYWPMRKFLLENELADDCYYGFFSPRFLEKTGLGHADVVRFIESCPADTDVVTFSPQPDMGAFFLNVFEQEELFEPGFLRASQAFLEFAGVQADLAGLIMDSRQIVFSNYFAAKPPFWRAWLALNEQLFAICEGEDSELKSALTFATPYPGQVQRKVFLMERIASLLLTLNPAWRVKAYSTFACAWSATRLGQFKLDAVLSDALKIAMREQGFGDYTSAFAQVRDRLR
ncbi:MULTISPECIES: hypothetical protein [Cupriavidus]|nr:MULTISPECIES: hypothetical protein [Cupriavidus]QYY32354.1 hypothetical protein K2O51_16350 [Cupriavidus pinatubonensis]TPQ31307.1 hypothetical protein C2U69_29215 [Cupriavidus pinatubonensis]